MRKILATLLLVISIAIPISADDFEFHGFIDATFASDFSKDFKPIQAKARFYPEIEYFKDGLYILASLGLGYDALYPKDIDFKVGEIYLEYAWEWGDFRLGRQIVSWGVADGLRITDIFSPTDYSNLVGANFLDSRHPVNGIQLRHFGDFYSIEFLWVPVYIPSYIAANDDKTPLSKIMFPSEITVGDKNVSVNYNYDDKNPPLKFTSGELGFRTAFFLPEIDFSFSLFRGWDHDLIYKTKVDTTPILSGKPAEIDIEPDYNRITMVGFDMAIPASVFVFKIESAWLGKRNFAPKNIMEPLSSHHQLKALFGFDCNPGKSWMINFQFMEDVVFENVENLQRKQHLPILTFRLSKAFLRETLKLAGSIVIGCNYGDTRTSLDLSYSVVDNLNLTLGAVVYQPGVENGKFGALKDLSHIYLRAKYSF